MQQGDGSDLLVDGVVGIGDPIAVILQHLLEPVLQQPGLLVIAERNSGVSLRATSSQKAITPGSARFALRASLITFVSTKNIGCLISALARPLEVRIAAHIRHGGQQLGQGAPWGCQQSSGQDRPMLGFGAATMGPGPFLESLHDGLIHATHQ
jgi:hypothetical protein